ncbi:MAG: hypothetical protein ABEJ02_00820 [Candidatus Paceibacteria bacterium]
MEPSNQNLQNKEGMSRLKKFGVLLLVLFLIASIFGLILFYQKYQESRQKIQTLKEQQPSKLDKSRKQQIINDLSQHMILPDSEPALATISNPKEMAKRDDFFKSAQKGDVMLVYPSKAIMYRPSQDKIVDVRPVVRRGANLGAGGSSVENRSAQQNQQKLLSVELRGALTKKQISALTKQVESLAGYKVARSRQSTSSYQNTTIVNKTKQSIDQLEQRFDTQATTTLPSTESTSTADVIILIGQDLIQQ